ncbi:MAG: hypothetical protein AAFX94_12345 [Myxococcota bacterium]
MAFSQLDDFFVGNGKKLGVPNTGAKDLAIEFYRNHCRGLPCGRAPEQRIVECDQVPDYVFWLREALRFYRTHHRFCGLGTTGESTGAVRDHQHGMSVPLQNA